MNKHLLILCVLFLIGFLDVDNRQFLGLGGQIFVMGEPYQGIGLRSVYATRFKLLSVDAKRKEIIPANLDTYFHEMSL